MLADGVHRARLAFLDVTVGLVDAADGVLLVDAGTTLTEAEAIDADVHAITGRPVTRIILTHKHFDHVLGATAFRGAEIYSAAEVADYLTTAAPQIRADALRHGTDAAEVDRATEALRAPDHRIGDTVIDLGDRSVATRRPGGGHTGADLIVVVPARDAADRIVVFCGDLVEESGDPMIDADSDLAAWPETLDRVLDEGGPDAIYVPGHGAVVDAEFVRRQQAWLRGKAALRPDSSGTD